MTSVAARRHGFHWKKLGKLLETIANIFQNLECSFGEMPATFRQPFVNIQRVVMSNKRPFRNDPFQADQLARAARSVEDQLRATMRPATRRALTVRSSGLRLDGAPCRVFHQISSSPPLFGSALTVSEFCAASLPEVRFQIHY